MRRHERQRQAHPGQQLIFTARLRDGPTDAGSRGQTEANATITISSATAMASASIVSARRR